MIKVILEFYEDSTVYSDEEFTTSYVDSNNIVEIKKVIDARYKKYINMNYRMEIIDDNKATRYLILR